MAAPHAVSGGGEGGAAGAAGSEGGGRGAEGLWGRLEGRRLPVAGKRVLEGDNEVTEFVGGRIIVL